MTPEFFVAVAGVILLVSVWAIFFAGKEAPRPEARFCPACGAPTTVKATAFDPETGFVTMTVVTCPNYRPREEYPPHYRGWQKGVAEAAEVAEVPG